MIASMRRRWRTRRPATRSAAAFPLAATPRLGNHADRGRLTRSAAAFLLVATPRLGSHADRGRVARGAAAFLLLSTAALVAAAPAPATGGPGGPLQAAAPPALADAATLTGTVASDAPFTAARVHIRNVDRRIGYMVYTREGRFRAVALFPGRYEVTAAAPGLTSDVQHVTLEAGERASVDLALAETSAPRVAAAGGGEMPASRAAAEHVAYDDLYPPGPGRDIAERTCMPCHGGNFLATRPARRAVWEAAIDKMFGRALSDRAAASYGEGIVSYRDAQRRFSLADRETLLGWLAEHFGPGAPPRRVRIDRPMPIDEAALGKAMYIEYYLPEDAAGEGVHADSRDNIWIGLWNVGKVAKFDPATEQWTEFTPPTYPGHVRRPNVDSRDNVWFGIYAAGPRPGKLVKLDQGTGRMTEYVIPHQDAAPYDVAVDADDNLWAADVGAGSDGERGASLWKFDPRTEAFTFYPKPQPAADSPKIQVTREGAVWYSPRGSRDAPASGVLYPDIERITTLGAYYRHGPPGNPFATGAGQ